MYNLDPYVYRIPPLGEQSVGKSYALNHFLDTSFAGSAMRCTEGVWMSLTETEGEVIVALDFEGKKSIARSKLPSLTHYVRIPRIGIHSIERSAQEDMLLVLFNTAVSNMVRLCGCTRPSL